MCIHITFYSTQEFAGFLSIRICAYKLFFLPIVAVTTATCAKVMSIVVISSSHPSND